MIVTTDPPRAPGVGGLAASNDRRRGTLGPLLLGGLGLGLAAGIAPRLDDLDRGFAFEPPPDPLQITFDPPTIVAVIGVLYLGAAIVLRVAARRGDAGLPLARTVARGVMVLLVPLVLVIALALSTASTTNVTQLLIESLRLGTPIALGAMAGLWCERSGVVNIGIEGMMLASAGVSFTVYARLGDAAGGAWLWLAILIAVLTGVLVAALHALMSITFRVDQIISGVAINLLALGVTGFLRSELVVPGGISSGESTEPIRLPLLSKLPIVGPQLFTAKPIFFAMFVIVALTGFVLFRTPWGLRVRSCGENPEAAATLGIDVIRTRYRAVLVGGAIAGLAGAWFSLETQGGFEDAMTNGTGFIALAALIFGKWRPGAAFGGALLFGFARALGARMQILNVEFGDFSIPSEFWQMLPFVVTIVVVAGVIGRAVAPAAVGKPYARPR